MAAREPFGATDRANGRNWHLRRGEARAGAGRSRSERESGINYCGSKAEPTPSILDHSQLRKTFSLLVNVFRESGYGSIVTAEIEIPALFRWFLYRVKTRGFPPLFTIGTWLCRE